MVIALLDLAAFISITGMLIMHILFMRSCETEAQNALSFDKMMNDAYVLQMLVRRLYEQRKSINWRTLMLVIICFLMFLGKLLHSFKG
jgi:hypothetical protein